jgi:hypothetical protein
VHVACTYSEPARRCISDGLHFARTKSRQLEQQHHLEPIARSAGYGWLPGWRAAEWNRPEEPARRARRRRRHESSHAEDHTGVILVDELTIVIQKDRLYLC